MKLFTLKDAVKTKKQRAFLSKIIDQAHADPQIKKLLNLDKESSTETKTRLFKEIDG